MEDACRGQFDVVLVWDRFARPIEQLRECVARVQRLSELTLYPARKHLTLPPPWVKACSRSLGPWRNWNVTKFANGSWRDWSMRVAHGAKSGKVGGRPKR